MFTFMLFMIHWSTTACCITFIINITVNTGKHKYCIKLILLHHQPQHICIDLYGSYKVIWRSILRYMLNAPVGIILRLEQISVPHTCAWDPPTSAHPKTGTRKVLEVLGLHFVSLARVSLASLCGTVESFSLQSWIMACWIWPAAVVISQSYCLGTLISAPEVREHFFFHVHDLSEACYKATNTGLKCVCYKHEWDLKSCGL